MSSKQRRKLEFFIGGTRRDLKIATKTVIYNILLAGHIPSGMELWSSGVNPLTDSIKEHLGQCDVHIIILGARYGVHVPGQEISFTEWEYNQSEIDNRPILVFLLNDKEFDEEREKEIAKDPIEKINTDALNKFRETLKKGRFCVHFSNKKAGIEILGKECINSIHKLINHGDLGEDVGWVRASSHEVSVLRQISKNKFLVRELKRMREFSIIGERVTLDAVSKQTLARVFWERMMGPIRRNGYKNLFFESGSTLSYISETFEDYVLKNDDKAESWNVTTNNVFTLLQLMLYTDINISRFPQFAPDPEDKYGAIFPHKWHKVRETAQTKPRGLHTAENEEVEWMKCQLKKFDKNTLFLATTSGWDTSDSDFQGPHVGSHPNMMFKRALFSTGCPVVIFLSADKLGDPFEITKCYPIYGPDLPFNDGLKNYPLALCIGYDSLMQSPTRRDLKKNERKLRNDPNIIKDTLTKLKFNVFYEEGGGNTGAIIAGNSLFEELIPNN